MLFLFLHQSFSLYETELWNKHFNDSTYDQNFTEQTSIPKVNTDVKNILIFNCLFDGNFIEIGNNLSNTLVAYSSFYNHKYKNNNYILDIQSDNCVMSNVCIYNITGGAFGFFIIRTINKNFSLESSYITNITSTRMLYSNTNSKSPNYHTTSYTNFSNIIDGKQFILAFKKFDAKFSCFTDSEVVHVFQLHSQVSAIKDPMIIDYCLFKNINSNKIIEGNSVTIRNSIFIHANGYSHKFTYVNVYYSPQIAGISNTDTFEIRFGNLDSEVCKYVPTEPPKMKPTLDLYVVEFNRRFVKPMV